MKIYKEKYKNYELIILENNILEVRIIPDLGFKIASIYHKAKDFEFIRQSEEDYEIPEFGDKFLDYDISGINEIIPTMEEDEYPEEPYLGLKLPDRGDVWSRPWMVGIGDGKVIGEILLKSLPLRFRREISLEDNKIRLDYEVENLVANDIKYLWTLQGLNYCNEHTEIILQDDMDKLVNVYSNEDLYGFDYKKIKNYDEDEVYKYFIWGDFEKGLVGLDYKDKNLKYLLNYDVEKTPELGVLVDRNRDLCSVEISNSFFDSISVAVNNHRYWEIKGKETDKWSVEILIEEY